MNYKTLIYVSALALTTMTAGAMAQPQQGDLMPAVSAQSSATPTESLSGETHPVLNLSPDKSELVRLDRDAHSVIIGNPDHAKVVLDTPRLAVVIPKAAGATYFTVLDKDGNIVMQRHVVVSAPKQDYVRIRRSCGTVPQGTDCKPTSVYFCPDMCHEIGNADGKESASSTSSAQ